LIDQLHKSKCPFTGSATLLTQYVTPVWTLEGRKWDMRTYMLIASVSPLVAFWFPGELKVCTKPFELHSNDLLRHITNTALGREQTSDWSTFFWSPEKLPTDLKARFGAAEGARRFRKLKVDIINVLLAWLFAVKEKLSNCYGNSKTDTCYQLMGFDVTVSEDLQPVLLDSNTGPGLGLKPDWIWDKSYVASSEMAQIVATSLIAKNQKASCINWPKMHAWTRIYDASDSDFYEGESSSFLRLGECYSPSSK